MDLTAAIQPRLEALWPRTFGYLPWLWGETWQADEAVRLRQRRLAKRLTPRLWSSVLPGIPGRVHHHDGMIHNHGRAEVSHYMSCGLSELSNVEAAFEAAGRENRDMAAILDFGSGYGRLTRHLVAQTLPGRITCADVDTQALAFLKREFRTKTLFSTPDFASLRFPEAYDLIWVGSVFTHLTLDDCNVLFRVLAAALAPSGLLVITTCGEKCLTHLPMYGHAITSREADIRKGLDEDGAFHVPGGPDSPRWGLTFHSREYVEGTLGRQFGVGLRLLNYGPSALDDHQDVWTYQVNGERATGRLIP